LPLPAVRARPAGLRAVVPAALADPGARLLPTAARAPRGGRTGWGRRETPVRRSAPTARPPALGGEAVRGRRAPGPARRRRAHGCRGRPLRQAESLARIRSSRAARARLPACPDRPVPPRRDAAVVGSGPGRPKAVESRAER